MDVSDCSLELFVVDELLDEELLLGVSESSMIHAASCIPLLVYVAYIVDPSFSCH